jgi:YegS/Rv2252/BmrU family lipid kinase
LIYNPTAGQRDRRAAMTLLIESLKPEGLELANAPTTAPGHATRIVEEFLPSKPSVVVVCGGDGTVSEAAAALLGTEVPLAIFPGGTSNVLALELNIPADLARARALLLAGTPRTVRVGLANGRPFLLMAGVGLDARIMGRMRPLLKRWLGRTGIFLTVAPEFWKYEFPNLDVEIDGLHYPATFAVVCNARHYAGDWIAAPEASVESDTLETVIFFSRRKSDLLNLFRGMRAGDASHLRNGFARIVRGRDIRICSRESYQLETQVDGDCVLETPVRCSVSDETLQVIAP